MLDDYLTHLTARRRSVQTIRIRRIYLNQLAARYPNLAAVTGTQLDQFIGSHPEWSRETVNTVIATFRGFYSWLLNTGQSRTNPAIDLPYLRCSRQVGIVAADDILRRGLNRATPRQRLALLLMSEAGLRRFEVAALPQTALRGDWLEILGKGEKWRSVPVTPALRAAFVQAPAVHGFWFPNGGGGHLCDRTIAEWCGRLTGYTPHALRRRYATRIYQATHDIRAVQLLLGHSSTLVTERYIGIDRDTLKAAAMTAGLAA